MKDISLYTVMVSLKLKEKRELQNWAKKTLFQKYSDNAVKVFQKYLRGEAGAEDDLLRMSGIETVLRQIYKDEAGSVFKKYLQGGDEVVESLLQMADNGEVQITRELVDSLNKAMREEKVPMPAECMMELYHSEDEFLVKMSKEYAVINYGDYVYECIHKYYSTYATYHLTELYQCGLVDRCHLSEVFRQAEESLINRNAKKIISGETNLDVGNDFKIQKCSPENIQKALKNNVCDLLRHYDASRIQVLSPVRKGSCGVKDGNTTIQNIFNPGKGGIWFGYRNYKLKDRVMMMSNNYALSYFNGDVGCITEIRDNYMEIQIGEEKIKLPTEKYGDMDLAYDSTVHKSQGSEYDYLIIVLQQEAMGMLDQNLLYTAVTRGKKEVRILYENDTLQKAITTGRTVKRNSHLVQRIYKELGI